MRIGLHRPDELLRIARHHLRHFLNCSPNILIVDSSIEEGIELAGPLDEWFSDISQQGGLNLSSKHHPTSILLCGKQILWTDLGMETH